MFKRDVLLWVILFIALPATAIAQSDLCVQPLPSVPNEARAEQLRIDAQERAQREIDRKGWDVKMFQVKNITPVNNPLGALCIFRVEVVFQSALRLVQVRAPKELMPEIEEAIKKLDVPPPPAILTKGIELTGYVVVAMEPADSLLMPLPKALEPVANQLKSILPNATLLLSDTFVARGVDRSNLSVQGNTSLYGSSSIRDGSNGPVIRIDNLNVQTRNPNGESQATFQTSVEVPVGTLVVIGKATPQRQGPVKAVILVINGRILDN
jgi:hypothetical protein